MIASGIIYDIKKFAVNDGPGIRTTVFFKGCPLSCWWCQNPESQQPDIQPGNSFQHKVQLKLFRRNDFIGKKVLVTEVFEEIKKDKIFYDESGGGVTFSGGEPLMQENFLTALLEICCANGIHTAVDTCGFAPYSVFEKINPLVNLYLFDLKIFENAQHQKYTGVSNMTIFENLVRLCADQKNIRLRIPLIPEITDTEKNLAQLIKFITHLKSKLLVDLLPYNKLGETKYDRLHWTNKLGKMLPQNSEKLAAIKATFTAVGIDVS